LYGEWSKEYALLTAWSRQALKTENIELFGYKESGIAAILAGALLDENITVSVEKYPKSFVFTNKATSHELSMGFCLPNILKWGDIDLAISLNANKVSFVD